MKYVRECSNFELMEPRLKGLSPEMYDSIQRGCQAAEEIQEMQNHWLYRLGRGGVSGEVLYVIGQSVKKAWRKATFRT